MECGWESGSKGECGPLQYEQTLALKLRGGPGLPSQTVAGRRVYACPATPSGVVVLGKVIVNHQVPWKHLLIPGLRFQWSQRLAQLRVAASGSDVCPKHLVSWTPHCSLQNIVIPVSSVGASQSMSPAVTCLASSWGGGTEQQVLAQFTSESLVLGHT